jgi:integrase
VRKKKAAHRRAKEALNVREIGPGVWEVRWYEAGRRGRYRCKRLRNVSRDEAEAYLLARRAEARAGIVSEASRVKFGEIAHRYLESHVPHLAESWQRNVKGYLEDLLVPAFGELVAASITPGDVQKYQTRRLAERTARHRPPSAETLNHEVRCLKAVLAFGVRERLLDRHPLPPRSVKPLPVPTEEERAALYFTPAEARALFGAFDDAEAWAAHVARTRRLGDVKFSPILGIERRFGGGRRPGSEASEAERLRFRAAVDVFKAIYVTGSRLGEIVGLRWGDVDLRAGLVRIYQQKVKRPKVLPIVPALRELLEAQLAHPKRRRKGDDPPPGSPVFLRPGGGPWDIARLERTFRLARKLSGVRPALRIHDLRHGAGTALTLAGTPDRLVQAFLGHKSGASTRRYQHAAAHHLEGAAGLLSAAAEGALEGLVNESVNEPSGRKRTPKRPKPG